MATAAPTTSRWLQGPSSDVLLGAGLLYIPFFVLSLFVGPRFVLGSFSPVPFLIILFAFSHLGATLLRVYGRAEDRQAYRLFALWATIPIALAFLVGMWVPIVGSVMLTIYLTVVPWHFTAQNYGIALVFLRRRGIEITPLLKRYVYLSFILSYALWILSLHASQPGTSEYSPLRLQGTQYSFLPIGIPAAALPYLVALIGTGYAYSLSEVAMRLRSKAPWRELLPTALLMLSQALWFSAPVVSRVFFEPSQLGPLAELWAPGNSGSTFLLISLMHSLQYLWITDYYIRKESPGTTTQGFLGKALLAGMAIFGIPFLLLVPEVGGGPSYEAGLFLMLNGALNVQHIMLDGVIWKLRHSKIASILIKGGSAPAAAPSVAPKRRWVPRLIWISGAIGLALSAGGEFETQFGLNPALIAKDPERIEASLTRLSWLGRDNSIGRARLAFLKYESGDLDGALREYERSVELSDKPTVWVKIGKIHEQQGQLDAALAAYETALELAPQYVDALVAAGRASYKTGQPDRARQLLAQAAKLQPEDPGISRMLATLEKATESNRTP